MPKVKSVGSLKTLCIENVAKNMDSFWCLDYIRNYSSQGKFLYFIGPFEYLTGDLIESLRVSLSQRKLLKRHHLQVLVNSHVTTLDLAPWIKYCSTELTLAVLGARCQRVTHLTLSNSAASAELLVSVVDLLPNLFSIDLNDTKCNDNVLRLISIRCPALRVLIVHDCVRTTDNGITHLIDAKLRLTNLNVTSTAVTHRGLEKALISIPTLRHLDCTRGICNALVNVYNSHAVDTLILRSLFLVNEDDCDAAGPLAEAVSRLCPHLTDLKLHGSVANNSTVGFTVLENIDTLYVAAIDSQPVVFTFGIEPFLQIRGASIVRLELIDVGEVNFESVATCCPNIVTFRFMLLHDLVSDANRYDGGVLSHNCQPFRVLEELTLYVVNELLVPSGAVLSASVLLLFLRNATRLKNLSLHGLDSLNDDVFLTALTSNPLQFLDTVNISFCNAVTGATVFRLINLESVSQMDLIANFNIARSCIDECRKRLKGKNFDLVLNWS